MKILSLLHLSTALTLVVSAGSYSIACAAEQKNVKEELVASSSAHLIQQSMDQRLQALEDQRDAADFRDYPLFKELTNEISSMIGAFPVGGVLPKGEELHRWFDFIIRTRHKFSGQVCLGKYGMANRYLQRLGDLDNPEHRNHIAVIMAIDAMVKLAIKDEDFSVMWSAQTLGGAVSDEFIERVLETLNAGQFGWPKKKVNASPPVKIIPLEIASHSAAIDASQKSEKQAKASVDIVLGPVVKDIFDHHSQRCGVYNTSLNEVFLDGEVQTKTDVVDQKTQFINIILRDRERVDVEHHANEDEKKAILQAVIGAEISTNAYQDVKRQALSLAPQLPTGLTTTDPRFKHFEILRLTEELSRNLVMHLKEHGYDALRGVSLNGIVGNTYANLFAYSGLEEEIFFDWFKEVFESHKAGFVDSTKRFEVDDLADGVRAVLTKRPDIVRLAGDIFDLYAPKLDLKAVYTEVIPSGGKWRGWDVHQADSFAHVINLTDEENAANPERVREDLYLDGEGRVALARIQEAPSLETQLRNEFSASLGTSTRELYSTSHKAASSAEDISLATVKYVYDHCLESRGHGVIGKGKVYFNLTRKIKPELKHLFAKKEGLPSDCISDLYRSTLAVPTLDMYAFWYGKGMPRQIASFAYVFINRKEPMLALKFLREAINLGDESDKNYLYDVLNNHGAAFYNGTNGVETNIENAIECFQEATHLNRPTITKNLILCAESLAYGRGVKRDIPRALILLREGLARHDKAVTNNTITYILNLCGYGFLLGGDDLEKNVDSAIECFQEQVNLGHAGGYTGLMACAKELIIGKNFKRNLPRSFSIFHTCSESNWHVKLETASFMNNCGAVMFNGTDGVEKNIEIAVECFQKAIDIGHRDAHKNLRICAYKLITEKGGAKNKQRAFEILKKSIATDSLCFRRDIALSLNSAGISLFNGDEEVERNIDLAIECFQEANHFDKNVANKYLAACAQILISGNGGIERDIPRSLIILRELIVVDWRLKDDIVDMLNVLGSNFFNGEEGFEKNITCAIECFQEAAYLGDKYANDNLVVCAKRLIVEKDIRDIDKALRILRDHTTIDTFARISRVVDFVRRGDTDYDKSDIAVYLNAVGAAFFNGTQGLEKNVQYALRFFEEAACLGDRDARKNLVLHAKSLITGKNNEKDMQKALTMLRRYSEGCSEKLDASSFLRECAIAFANGAQGFKKNAEMAKNLMKEASNFYRAAGFNGSIGF